MAGWSTPLTFSSMTRRAFQERLGLVVVATPPVDHGQEVEALGDRLGPDLRVRLADAQAPRRQRLRLGVTALLIQDPGEVTVRPGQAGLRGASCGLRVKIAL